MDSFVIKTERVEQDKKSKLKRQHTVVLSDGEDDQAQARAAESRCRSTFPDQLMAYLKRIDGMHEVFSSEESIVFDRSGTFDGELYLARGNIDKATAPQGAKQRRRLTQHDVHDNGNKCKNKYDDECLPDDVLAALTLPQTGRSSCTHGSSTSEANTHGSTTR